MFKKCNKILAFLLAIALVTTTFGSDFANAKVFAVEQEMINALSEESDISDLSFAEEVTTTEKKEEANPVSESAKQEVSDENSLETAEGVSTTVSSESMNDAISAASGESAAEGSTEAATAASTEISTDAGTGASSSDAVIEDSAATATGATATSAEAAIAASSEGSTAAATGATSDASTGASSEMATGTSSEMATGASSDAASLASTELTAATATSGVSVEEVKKDEPFSDSVSIEEDGIIIHATAEPGVLPNDAVLKVEKVVSYKEYYIENVIDNELGENADVEETYSYDINIYSASSVSEENPNGFVQPEQFTSVEISFEQIEAAADEDLSLAVYHVEDNLLNAEEVASVEDTTATDISFDATHFSIYTVTIYKKKTTEEGFTFPITVVDNNGTDIARNENIRKINFSVARDFSGIHYSQAVKEVAPQIDGYTFVSASYNGKLFTHVHVQDNALYAGDENNAFGKDYEIKSDIADDTIKFVYESTVTAVYSTSDHIDLILTDSDSIVGDEGAAISVSVDGGSQFYRMSYLTRDNDLNANVYRLVLENFNISAVDCSNTIVFKVANNGTEYVSKSTLSNDDNKEAYDRCKNSNAYRYGDSEFGFDYVLNFNNDFSGAGVDKLSISFTAEYYKADESSRFENKDLFSAYFDKGSKVTLENLKDLIPEYCGYTLNGLYTNEECTIAFSEFSSLENNEILYAKFIESTDIALTSGNACFYLLIEGASVPVDSQPKDPVSYAPENDINKQEDPDTQWVGIVKPLVFGINDSFGNLWDLTGESVRQAILDAPKDKINAYLSTTYDSSIHEDDVIWYVYKYNKNDWYHIDGYPTGSVTYVANFSGAPDNYVDSRIRLTTTSLNYTIKDFATAFPSITNSGYSFIGWNTKEDGSGDNYPIKEINLKKHLTLYAQWKYEGTEKITIKAVGGSKTYDGEPIEGSFTTKVKQANGEEKDTLPGGCKVEVTYSFVGEDESQAQSSISMTNVLLNDQKEVVGKQFKITSYKILDASGADCTSVYKDNVTLIDTATLTVNPLIIKARSGSKQKQYDGSDLTDPRIFLDDKNDPEGNSTFTFVKNEPITIEAVGKVKMVLPLPVENTIKVTYGENVIPTNYKEVLDPGNLKVTIVAGDNFVLRALDDTKMYDGSALTRNSFEVVSVPEGYENYSITAQVVGTVTEVGEAKNVIDRDSVKFYDGTEDVTDKVDVSKIKLEDGKLTVTKRPLELTSGSAKRVYNGEPLKAETVSITGGSLAPVDSFDKLSKVVGISDYASITYKGTKVNTYSHSETSYASKNYSITYKSGNLEITAREGEGSKVVVYAQDATKMYDGTPLTSASAAAPKATGLVSGDTAFVTTEGSVTNVKDSKTGNNIITKVVIRNADGEDVTENYTSIDMDHPGSLTITPRYVQLKSGSAEKVFDGSPLTNKEITVSYPVETQSYGFVKGEEPIYNVIGSQTKVGTSDNTFTYKFSNDEIAANYVITTVLGELKVTPLDKKWKVNVSLHADAEGDGNDTYVLYNGQEQTADLGVKIHITAESTTVEQEVEQGTNQSARATGISLLNAAGNVLGSMFANVRSMFVITAAAAEKEITQTVEFEGVEFTVSGLRVYGGSGIDVNDEGYEIILDYTGMKITTSDGTDVTNDVTDRVDKEVIGHLYVLPREVTFASESASKVYDGTALTATNITVGGKHGFADGESATFNVTGSQLNPGSSENTFTYELVNAKESNYIITTETGTLTVTDGNNGDTPDDNGTPDDGTPDDGTPDDGTPDDGTPDDGTPDDGTPDDGTPDDGTPSETPTNPNTPGDGGQVLGATRSTTSNGQVLGATRSTSNGGQVLGARKGGTGDSTNTVGRIVTIIFAAGIGFMMIFIKRKKEEE